MPLLFAAIVSLGVSESLGWRLAMVVPGAILFLVGIAYYFFTQDLPDGNFGDLRARGELPTSTSNKGAFREAASDPRVWALFLIYGACFGVELTINNIAALYYRDSFSLDIKTAGLIAGLWARTDAQRVRQLPLRDVPLVYLLLLLLACGEWAWRRRRRLP